MKISLDNISKRFQGHWIFKNINYSFSDNKAYAILGANGSGKSTLMRIVAGMQPASKGNVRYTNNATEIGATALFPLITYCAPGQEIIEELSLKEFLEFHFTFKNPIAGLDIPQIITLIGLEAAANKPIAEYSSGMKQRVKLAQAIFSDTPVLLLDEPCTNLDRAGVEQCTGWMEQYAKDRLVIVASNDVREYYFCKEHITLEDYR